MSEEDLKNIASQLSKPQGESGIKIAEMMHATNFSMTSDCIDQMELKKNDAVLEIGHGNCGHLSYLLNKADNLKYTGLEISTLMSDEAKQINRDLLNKKVEFLVYDGERLPFENKTFDAVFTVNTIYFWKNTKNFLNEINRILNEKGRLLITMADKTFMEKLPFTQYIFTLYSVDEIEQMAQKLGFELTSVKENTDEVMSKVGDLVTRKFYTLTLMKR